jgi:D-3-phosphoglycerate dehydrogenase
MQHKILSFKLTPHTAALTQECTARVAMEAVKGVIDFIQGKTPRFVYNKEVLS